MSLPDFPPQDEPSSAELLASAAECALFDDNQADHGARLCCGLRQYLCAWTADELPGLFAEIDHVSSRGHWVSIAATYELGYALNSKLQALAPTPQRPLIEAWVWRKARSLSAQELDEVLVEALARLSPAAQHAGVAELKVTQSGEEHAATLRTIESHIKAGDCYQVNDTFALRGQAYGDPLALYARLRQAQPVRYGAFIRHARGTILSRSPELFVERTGRQLRSRPMKGTVPLGEAAALRTSEKDRAENLMIVDLLRNDMGRLAPPGGVRVEKLFAIEDYASLHQMTSTVIAEPVSASLGEILAALFPCGSITGAPKIRAMELIRELEPEPRKLYCGALGWLAPNGDFCFNVPIRTLEIDLAANAWMGLGGGIVADSIAPREYAECLTKGRFLSALPAGFELFETLLLSAEGEYPLLARHLARMSRSAKELGFPFSETAARQRLQTQAEQMSRVTHRVRLTLDAAGQLGISGAPLPPLPRHQTVTVSREPQNGQRALRGHKTSARGQYERALGEAIAGGHFDVLFLNSRGEVCEGARSNVFIERKGHLLTPPRSSGLLPGVMREELLEHGWATEARLTLADLVSAPRVFVSNALRGLIEVSLTL